MIRTAKSVARAVLIPIFCRGAVMCVTPLFAETVPVSGGMDVAAAVFPNPEGSKKFKTEDVDKIMSVYKDDIKELLDKLSAVTSASGEYNNFSGIADGTEGEVKFIFETEAIRKEK